MLLYMSHIYIRDIQLHVTRHVNCLTLHAAKPPCIILYYYACIIAQARVRGFMVSGTVFQEAVLRGRAGAAPRIRTPQPPPPPSSARRPPTTSPGCTACSAKTPRAARHSKSNAIAAPSRVTSSGAPPSRDPSG